ncbi:MAG: FixH family protein [Longimicrobiales bacterium]
MGLTLLLLLPLLAFTGCRGDEQPGDPGLLLEVGISPTPPGVGPARLIITLRDTLGVPLEGAEIQVEGNMSHAGMTPVTGTAVARGQGLYSIPDFTFTMAGDWILMVTATLPDGRWTQLRVPTNVVGAPSGGRLD